MTAALIAAALASLSSPAVCYDRAVVGYIRHADHAVDLDTFVKPGDVVLGARMDVEIAVETTLAGPSAPRSARARAVLTHPFKPTARLLILLRDGPIDAGRENGVQEWRGGFIPDASREFPWRVVAVYSARDGATIDDPRLPPRCA